MRSFVLSLLLLMSLANGKAQNCAYTTATLSPGVYQFFPDSLLASNTSSFLWTVNNGANLTQPSPILQLNPGGYEVCVNYYDTVGLLCSYCDSLWVPAASCTFSSSPVPGTLFMNFQANSLLPGQVAYWTFGDNTSGYGNPIQHAYPPPGASYTVCLQILDTMTQTVQCSGCQTVTVGAVQPSCSFTYQADPINPLMYVFTASPAYPGSTIQWTLGDGTSATGPIITHVYAQGGVYVACMNEYDSTGTLVCSHCPSFLVDSAGPCGINNVDYQNGMHLFQVGQQLPGATVQWDFGDSLQGQGDNVYHTYASPGSYTVVVTQIDSSGQLLCANSILVVDSFAASGCVISYLPTSPSTFLFSVNPFPSAVGYNWDFGDGMQGTGTNIMHVYPMPGTYNVCVSVTGGGAILCTACIVVVVSPVQSSCSAYFVSSVVGMDAYFIDLSSGTNASTQYAWDFGDGFSATTRFPMHTYTVPGIYTACLTITDSVCSNQFCSTVVADTQVVIPSGCQANFVTLQLAPYQLAVVNLSNGTNLNFVWDFGDGSTSNQPYPSHVYASTGSYPLCLTVSDASGCSNTFCDTVAVDSSGNIFRTMTGFTISVLSPSMLSGVNDPALTLPIYAFPNPAQDRVTLRRSADAVGTASVRWLSLTGAVVLQSRLGSGSTTMDVSGLSPGMYVLELTESDGRRGFSRWIIQ